MITIGYLGDKIGRKWGSVCTVSLMCVGAILLTVQNAPTDRGQVIFCESLCPTAGPHVNWLPCSRVMLPCKLCLTELLGCASAGKP